MRGLFGTLLIVCGLVLVYLFGALGIAAAKAANTQPVGSIFSLPLQTLGKNYPKDALCLAGGIGALAWGLYLLTRGAKAPAAPMPLREPGRPSSRPAGLQQAEVTTGTYARGFCVLSLGACIAWGIAAVGASVGAREAVIGGFVAVAGLALLEGLVLGILGFFEQKKPVIVLAAGWVLFLAALGIGVAGIAMGG